MKAPLQLQTEYVHNPVGIDTPRPRFGWLLESDRRGERQTAYQVIVADSQAALDAGSGTLWDSGKVQSDRSHQIEYAGAPLRSNQQLFWKVRVWDSRGAETPWSEAATFAMGLLEPADWQGQWIGSDDATVSSPLLRKEISLRAGLRRATVHLSGLGYSELYLNGAKVGDSVLDPGNTYYHNDQPIPLGARVLYVSHDVSALLSEGANALGVMLGHGWYSAEANVPPAPSGRAPYGDRPRLLLQLILEYADGTTETVVSDTSWKTHPGPVTYNEYCNGESYDARLEQDGWATAGFDDSVWQPAVVLEAPNGKLVAQTMPPERVVATITPLALTQPSPGVFIFDLGQTITGWSKIRVRGAAGTKVMLKHGTALYADGTLDARSNLYNLPENEEKFRQGMGRRDGYHHAALQEDHYTLRGDGEEVWEPRFTLHSFRYVEVTGYPGTPALDDLAGRVVHNDLETSGRFASSNALYNQIHSNVYWTLRGSFQSIPQDAADRSERQGWLGDPGYITEDYLYNFHSAAFWTKWMNDIQDSQLENGDLPIVSPIHWRTTYDPYARVWPDWSSTYALYLWHVYFHYDDRRLLTDHYESLKKMVDRNVTLTDGHIMNHGLGDHMEPQPEGYSNFTPNHTPMALTSTAWHYYTTRTLARMAGVLGRDADLIHYDEIATAIKDAFNAEFLDGSTNQYGTGSQTSNAVALFLGLVPPERVDAVGANLVDDIVAHDNHLTTGIMGTAALENVLPRLGRADVMARIMAQTTFPSWGDQIARGATTVWETWDGDPERELSLNMKMFCSTEVFFYGALAGIRPARAGYKEIAIRPNVVGNVTFVDAAVNTQHGTVAVAWQRTTRGIDLQIAIPVNTTTQVAIPKLGATGVTVFESDTPVWRDGMFCIGAAGVVGREEVAEAVLFDLGSGEYAFRLEGTAMETTR